MSYNISSDKIRYVSKCDDIAVTITDMYCYLYENDITVSISKTGDGMYQPNLDGIRHEIEYISPHQAYIAAIALGMSKLN